jgi:outer membrane receptor protein involved in Fe transport
MSRRARRLRTRRPAVRPFARALAVAAAALTAAPGSARAQGVARDTAARDSARVTRLAPVITEVTRAAAGPAESPRRVNVITRADIERTAQTSVVDVLKKLAAVDVIQYPSLLAGVGIRGFRPRTGGLQQRTLVLVDGRPSGAYNLALLDLQNVERVEVLKGPASALYGSSAMGGVVNLVTRRSAGRPTGAVSASYGTFQTSELTARAGGAFAGRLDGDLSLRFYAQGDDYRIGEGNAFRRLVSGDSALKIYPTGAKPARWVGDTVGDGVVRGFSTFRTRSGAARVGASLGGGLRADVRGELFQANDVLSPGDIYAVGTNATGDGRKNVARRSGDVALSGAVGAHAPVARVYAARENGENYDAPGGGSFVSFGSETSTAGAQLQDAVRLGEHTLVAGADYTRADAESRRFALASGAVGEIGTFSPNSRVGSLAAFAETRLRFLDGRLTGYVGGRLDRVTLDLLQTPLRPDVTAGREAFAAFNPSGGLQVELAPGLRLHGTAGRAFVAPDAFGRAGFARTMTGSVAALTVGNPTLGPERSVTVDGGVGVERPAWGLDADVTYFRTTVEDRVTRARASFTAATRPTAADGTPVGRVETSVNAGEADIRGLEARAGYDLGRATGRAFSLRLFGNATRIFRAEERTPAASIDAARFARARNFDAAQVFDAFAFSDTSVVAPIRNVASLTLTSGLEYDDRRRLSGRLAGRYVGRRRDTDFSDATDVSDIEYPPFLVLDLTAGVRLGGRYQLSALASNLTDENYYEKRGYNLPGRAVQLRLSAGF